MFQCHCELCANVGIASDLIDIHFRMTTQFIIILKLVSGAYYYYCLVPSQDASILIAYLHYTQLIYSIYSVGSCVSQALRRFYLLLFQILMDLNCVIGSTKSLSIQYIECTTFIIVKNA